MIWPIVAGAASTVVLNELFAAEADQFWGEKTGWNDASDAFRHAYVSARFAQYFGEHTPNILGIVHESVSQSDDPRDAAMDIWNNRIIVKVPE